MEDREFDEVVGLFGGITELASSLGYGVTAIHNWRLRGISNANRWRLFLLARRHRKTLPEWFFVDMEDEQIAA